MNTKKKPIDSVFALAFQRRSKSSLKQPLAEHVIDESLFVRAKSGDEEAKKEIIMMYKGIVIRIAFTLRSMFSHSKIELADLIQHGILGMLQALEKYDPKKGAFTSYAPEYILASMEEYIASLLYPLSVKKSGLGRLMALKKRIREENISLEGLDSSERKKILSRIYSSSENPTENHKCLDDLLSVSSLEEVSLYKQIGDENGDQLQDVIPSSSSIEEEVCNRIRKLEMLKLLSKKLNNKELLVLILHHGVLFDRDEEMIALASLLLGISRETLLKYLEKENGKGCLTYEDIGSILNRSRETVRQIEQGAVARLSQDEEVKKFFS